MPRITLAGGAYQSSALIASAQRCVNLFPENLPQTAGEPVPVTHMLTPGLRRLAQLTPLQAVRGLYRATSGDLYVAVGNILLTIGSDWVPHGIVEITPGSTPVIMADNGVDLLIVDGSAKGWFVDLTTHAPTAISDGAFYGADRVDLIGTAFVLNRPDTRQFYLGDSIARTFDPLYISNKGGRQDKITSLAVVGSDLWLFGTDTSEIWTFTGAADFPLQQVPGAVIEYGCEAKHSIGRTDKGVFWLSRSKDGHAIVLQGTGYQAKRVSTHAIEHAIFGYADPSGAVGGTYQNQGHTFYVLSFAEATWVYDIATEQWHEWSWLDPDGVEQRHRANCFAFAFNMNICGDWDNGRLYALDPAVFTDDGAPIKRVRSFPHASGDGRRLLHKQFQADMQVGDVPATDSAAPPQVFLRWSDDTGASWGNALGQSLGATGQYLARPQWRRLGISANRVWELSWSAPMHTALNGAFVTGHITAT